MQLMVYMTKHPPIQEDVLVKIFVGYNANKNQCRRRESNPHSRREHDFESYEGQVKSLRFRQSLEKDF